MQIIRNSIAAIWRNCKNREIFQIFPRNIKSSRLMISCIWNIKNFQLEKKINEFQYEKYTFGKFFTRVSTEGSSVAIDKSVTLGNTTSEKSLQGLYVALIEVSELAQPETLYKEVKSQRISFARGNLQVNSQSNM